jgi:hypothetical protein
VCRNPSLGLATKVKGLQGCGPRGSSGVTPHAPRSAREWGEVNPHTPKGVQLWELESRWTLEFLEGNFRGQNSMVGRVLYTIEKILERRCLKWDCITHLDIWNINYGQKKGRESNCQFDSRPLKVGNRPDLIVNKGRVTYRWKALDESYNFSFDRILIGGLLTKLWGSKVVGVPTWEISGLPLRSLGTKSPFGCRSREQTQSIL